MKTLIFISITTLLFLISCQERTSTNPEEIADEYYKAAYEMDWGKMTGLLHPNSLAEFRKNMLTVAGLVDSSFKSDGIFDSLSIIKGYQVDTLFSFLRNKKTLAMNDSEFFYSFCKIVYPYLPPALNVQPDSIINIGYLMEGSDTAHVLTRIRITRRNTPLSGLQTLSLARHKNSWRVLLPDELENILKMQLTIRKSRLFNN